MVTTSCLCKHCQASGRANVVAKDESASTAISSRDDERKTVKPLCAGSRDSTNGVATGWDERVSGKS